MACYSVTKHGFTTLANLVLDVSEQISNSAVRGDNVNYFTKVFQTAGSPTTGYKVLFESNIGVDPMYDYVPTGNTISSAWRFMFNFIDDNRLAVHAGTKLQYSDAGGITYLNNRSTTPALREPPGNISESWTTTSPASSGQDAFDQVFINRQPDVGSEGAYPMSYTLTLTNRGILFAVWEDSQEEVPQVYLDSANDGSGNSPLRWFLIQRPVDRLNGHVRGGGALRKANNPALTANQANNNSNETSRCPVYCLGGTGIPNEFYKFIVRENDVLSPSRKRYASVSSEDSPALINPYPQQSLTEGGEFVVTFINNLSTPRYRYSDELDMLGTVGAEVIGAGTSISVNVYNETPTRTYTALYSNRAFGTGMRLVALTAANAAAETSHITAT